MLHNPYIIFRTYKDCCARHNSEPTHREGKNLWTANRTKSKRQVIVTVTSQKDGNKPVKAGIKKEKTYQAFSTVYIDDLGKFTIEWFCEERKEPIGLYEHMLEGYRGRNYYKDSAAQSFIKNEFKMLSTYLWRRYNWIAEHSQKKFRKVSETILQLGEAGIISTVNATKELRYVDLSAQDGYDLPFKVSGYGHMIV